MAVDEIQVVMLSLDELPRHADALHAILRREIQAVIVKDVFRPDVLASCVERLLSGDVKVPHQIGPLFKGIYGRPIATAQTDLDAYLKAVPPFLRGCSALFGDTPTMDGRIEGVLRQVSGGRPVSVPAAPDGRAYLPATIRELGVGGALPLHYENGTWERGSSTQLRGWMDLSCLMSFYVLLQLPERGGALNVYTSDCLGTGDRVIRDLGPERTRKLFMEKGHTELKPAIGDLLIFDGGRHYHEVTTVEGARSRWTLGGFIAFTKEHDRIHFWS